MADLAGELSLLAGHELLGLLGAHGVTGQLQLVRAGVQRRISLLDGSAIAAASSDPREHLGSLLVRAGHVSFEAAEQAYKTQLETSLPIGRILTMTGLVSETVVRFTIHAKIRETVLDVATWGEGKFEFSGSLEVPEATGLEVALPLVELVEAARPRIERMQELRRRFPSGSTKVVTVTGARATPGSHEALLLEATRRPQTIDDLGVVMHEAPLRILEQVAALVDAGLLRVDEPGSARKSAPRTATPPHGVAPLGERARAAAAPELYAEPAPDLFAEPAPDLFAEPAPDLFAEPAPDLFAEPAPDLGAQLFEEPAAPPPAAPAADLSEDLFAEPAGAFGDDLFAEPVEPAPSPGELQAELFAEATSSELDELAAELAGPGESSSFESVQVEVDAPAAEEPAPDGVLDVADELFGELTSGAPPEEDGEGTHDLVVDDDDGGGLDAATGAVLDDERIEADAQAASDELALDTLPSAESEEEPWFPVDEAPAEDVRTPSQLVAAARQAQKRGAHEEALELAQRALAREHGEETLAAVRSVEADLLVVLRAELLGKGFFPLLTLERADVRSMSLSPPERFFLARMDGQRELAALVKLVPLRELDALRLVKKFRAAGHVIAAAPPPAPTAPAPAG